MKDLAELERRITAALARIGTGLDQLQAPGGGTAAVAEPEADTAGLDLLRAALDAEREVTGQLRNALALAETQAALAVAEPQDMGGADPAEDTAALLARIEDLTRQVDVQGLELQRMRQSSIQLRETLRALREQVSDGVEPHLINRAMLAELEALRAARSAEAAELGAILAELAPILDPAEVADARG